MTSQSVPTPDGESNGDVGDVGDVDFSAPSPDEFRPETAAEMAWIWTGYVAPRRVTLLTSLWKEGKTTLPDWSSLKSQLGSAQ